MDRDIRIERAIRQRDVRAIVDAMFEGGDVPAVRPGFGTETELWDYKADCPFLQRESVAAWADLAKEVLAFHNRKGGLLIFGIDDQYQFKGATTLLDSKKINDRLRRYLPDTIWVEFHRSFIQPNQRYLGLALIPSRGNRYGCFLADSPEVGGRKLFNRGDSAIRKGDSSVLLSSAEVEKLSRQLALPQLGEVYRINEPSFRILAPDYEHFVYRNGPCSAVESALANPRVAIAAITGIGGVGKTALATWATLRAFDRKDFDFIVSITAKDRELGAGGIQPLDPSLTSFESLLNGIIDTTDFNEYTELPVLEKEARVRELLSSTRGLLFVDNLETVDDPRIVQFLDSLPVGPRAIVTSRRASVRVAIEPVDVGPLSNDEIIEFTRQNFGSAGCVYADDLTDDQLLKIGEACDRIPLAIRWVLGRATSCAEALAMAKGLAGSGKANDQLLEFCFRRLFDEMPDSERAVLYALALYQRPLPSEPIYIACDRSPSTLDILDQLVADSLVQRVFDPNLNENCYTIIPLTRRFVTSEINQRIGVETKIRSALANWYEARDVSDPTQRIVTARVRQGEAIDDTALVDLALDAEGRGHDTTAERLYEMAITKAPKSWRACRTFAEFLRKRKQSPGRVLQLYEQAAAHAPPKGSDRAIVFREWGLLLRMSGEADAVPKAIEALETAHKELPRDGITLAALSALHNKKGRYNRVVELLVPALEGASEKTLERIVPLLAEAYARRAEKLELAALRQKFGKYINP